LKLFDQLIQTLNNVLSKVKLDLLHSLMNFYQQYTDNSILG